MALPVLARELQIRAKLAKTRWIRVGTAAFALFGWLLPIVLGRAPVWSGRYSLLTLSFCPMILSIFCGVATTSDCVSREKREGTLALLLLTHVRPFEILLQKVFSTSAPFLSGLISVLPLCGLPIILGGVSGSDVFVVMLLITATALVSVSFGCLISCCVRSAHSAICGTFLAVIAVFGVPWLLHWAFPRSLLSGALVSADPVYVYAELFATVATTISVAQGLWVLTSAVGLSTSFVLCGALLLPRSYSGEFSPWLGIRNRAEDFLPLAGELTIVLTALVLQDERLLLGAGLISANLVKLAVLLATVRVLGNRPWLESLLTTPADPLMYLIEEGKRILRKLIPVLAIALCALGVILFRLSAQFRDTAFVLGLFVIFDSLALALVGLWNGLKCRSPSHAISLSISSVVLVPVCIAALSIAFGFRTETLAGALLLWTLLGLGVDFTAACNAHWMLRNRLRLCASTQM